MKFPFSFWKTSGGAAATAWVTSFSGGSTRADFNCAAGVKITVGASNINVTQLGRWIVPGNSQSHTLYICTGADGLPPVVLGSVTINAAGAPTNAWLYGTLSSPVVMLAGQTYYILSSELSGFDEWFNANITPVLVGGIATATQAAYATGTIVGLITDTGVMNTFYVPVNFKYSSP